MPPQLFAYMTSWLLAAAPLVVLAGVALLGRAIGEWGRDALLAYAAVLLAFLSGVSGAGAGGSGLMLYAVPVLGVLAAFLGLTLGSFHGLLVLVVAYGALTASTLAKAVDALPWPLLVIAAAACAIVAARYYKA
jgi:hypothetical protein